MDEIVRATLISICPHPQFLDWSTTITMYLGCMDYGEKHNDQDWDVLSHLYGSFPNTQRTRAVDEKSSLPDWVVDKSTNYSEVSPKRVRPDGQN